MGNSLGGKKTVKVMKINGETIKFKAPIEAGEVVKDYPGFVLLESESVKHYGVRSKPLETHQKLNPKRLYFLVELPKLVQKDHPQFPRRVRSAINMSAKDRLESLMLARRSTSDLSIMKPMSVLDEENDNNNNNNKVEVENGATRVKMRLPKAEVERLLKESRDDGEAADKILGLYMEKRRFGVREIDQKKKDNMVSNQVTSWKANHGGVNDCIKARERRVSFMPIMESEIQIAIAT